MKINRLIFSIAVIALISSVTACDDPPDNKIQDDGNAEGPDYENIGMDGTPDKPFKVYNERTLRRVGTGYSGTWALFACYEQTADIVLPGGSNWTAIGNSNSYFTGTYDGRGHTISNLTVNAAAANYQGMFGYITNSATVKNVGIINGNVRGSHNTGGVVGLNNGGTVQNCYFSGSVTGGNSTGGVVGFNTGKIQNCYSKGSVTVSISGEVGGVAGDNGNSGTVQNCYSTASVSGGAADAGGVVGFNAGTVQNCAALNPSVTISQSGSNIGRVAGKYNSGTLAKNYAHSSMILKDNWNGNEKSPVNNAAGADGESISTGQYNNEAWWENAGNWKTDGGASAWDFVNIWEWDSAAGLPILKK